MTNLNPGFEFPAAWSTYNPFTGVPQPSDVGQQQKAAQPDPMQVIVEQDPVDALIAPMAALSIRTSNHPLQRSRSDSRLQDDLIAERQFDVMSVPSSSTTDSPVQQSESERPLKRSNSDRQLQQSARERPLQRSKSNPHIKLSLQDELTDAPTSQSMAPSLLCAPSSDSMDIDESSYTHSSATSDQQEGASADSLRRSGSSAPNLLDPSTDGRAAKLKKRRGTFTHSRSMAHVPNYGHVKTAELGMYTKLIENANSVLTLFPNELPPLKPDQEVEHWNKIHSSLLTQLENDRGNFPRVTTGVLEFSKELLKTGVDPTVFRFYLHNSGVVLGPILDRINRIHDLLIGKVHYFKRNSTYAKQAASRLHRLAKLDTINSGGITQGKNLQFFINKVLYYRQHDKKLWKILKYAFLATPPSKETTKDVLEKLRSFTSTK